MSKRHRREHRRIARVNKWLRVVARLVAHEMEQPFQPGQRPWFKFELKDKAEFLTKVRQ